MKWTQGVAVSGYEPESYFIQIEIPKYRLLDTTPVDSIDAFFSLGDVELILSVITAQPEAETIRGVFGLTRAVCEEAADKITEGSRFFAPLLDGARSSVSFQGAALVSSFINLSDLSSGPVTDSSASYFLLGAASVQLVVITYSEVRKPLVDGVNSALSLNNFSITLT